MKFSCTIIKQLISTDKIYYPYFLSPGYEELCYSPEYHKQAKDLKISKKNIKQISHQTLGKFLQNQIEEDKTLFKKEKQIIFVGRSNSGKSSLINTIFNDSTIARKSKLPGTTAFLHFHQIHNANAYVVDAPGYGYANMNKRRRALWLGLTEEYLKISSRISQIYLCINFQHGLKDTDIKFLQKIHKLNINIQIVMTKVDKIKQKHFYSNLISINQSIRRLQLNNINDRIIACSIKTKFGIDIMRCRLVESIHYSKQRNIDLGEDLLLSYIRQMRVAPIQLQQSQKKLSKQHIVRKLIYNSKLTKYLI